MMRNQWNAHKFTADEIDNITAAYRGGESFHSIAVRLGFGDATIKRLLTEQGFDTGRKPRRGADSPGWKGGRLTTSGGYIIQNVPPDHPMARRVGGSFYVSEHRLVMAEQLGRPLLPTESVHHIDGDRTNNDPSNLQLRHAYHGKGQAYQCADCWSTNIEPIPLEGE